MSRRHRRHWFALLAVGLGVLACRSHDRPLPTRALTRLTDFTLRGSDGRAVRCGDFADRAALVLFFTGVDCPNSNKSIPVLVDLASRYGPKGVSFLAVNSNDGQDDAAIAAHASEYGLTFPVGKDPGNVVADRLVVERTCEAVVLDRWGVVRYHGAIDDRFGRGTVRAAGTHPYLAEALDAMLAGRPVAVATSRVVGCPIQRVRTAPATARVRPAAPEIVRALAASEKAVDPIAVGPVTYTGEVAAILQRKCQACHRPGQEAPFALLSYDDARRRAVVIGEVVDDRRMPPWHADPRYGHFRNDRSLSPRERATLLAWIEQGTPEGDPTRLPPPRSFPDGWSIGTPDRVLAIPEANEVPPVGVLDYVLVTVPTGFTRDMWIQAAEIRPEVRSIVHHIIVQVLGPDGTTRDRGDHLATYVPGDAPTTYAPGTAKLIPAGSVLKFGIHYVPDGIARVDRSAIGLIFAREPVRHRAYTHTIEDNRFQIPPHADAHPVAASFVADAPLHITSFAPHMHVRGKDIRYTATYPDGRSEILLSVPAYDFGWQSSYLLAEPAAIPRGTRIDCLAHFDNSAANPANPDPSARVEWGEQSFQEMMIGYFDYVLDAPAARQP